MIMARALGFGGFAAIFGCRTQGEMLHWVVVIVTEFVVIMAVMALVAIDGVVHGACT
jgi:hypothetical protein